jgi:two-component system phosphate regulon sensor histidine kinase PhoR
MFRNIRWRIAIPYVVLILLAMLGLSIYLSNLMREAHLAGLKTQLTAEARLLADSAAPLLSGGEGSDALDSLARRWADLLGARVTIIGVDGTVLGESHEDRARMEVQQALLTGQGCCIRFSRTVGYEMIYVAIPVTVEEQVTGIVRIALPLRQIEDSVGRLRQTVLEATLLMALLAALLALFIAERTARPVRQLTRVAERMAE